MKKFLKFLLVVFIWLLIATALVFGALAVEQPVENGFIALGVLFTLWLVFLLVRRIIVRRRARQRAEALINQEMPPADSQAAPPRRWPWQRWSARTHLERRFRRLVRLLRGSRLREQGDPLYVLPWYMLLGQDNAGKTSLIRDADLAAPSVDDEALRGDGDCVDWWLYNEAIVLDTPGSYIGVDQQAARHPEWPTLLKILAVGHIREPLNGVVVTLPVEHLQNDTDSLFEQGKLIRKRIDELMRATKLRLPVYLTVTKSDQITGFPAWCQALPRESLDQPMGRINTGNTPVEAFVNEAIEGVADRIKRLMLVLISEHQVDADLMRLPLAIESLRSPLNAFADGLFQANSFEESPRFQGLYFTGRYGSQGRQAFARHLFSDVLPADRRVPSTLSGAERAERNFRRLVLSGWGAAMIILFALLTSNWLTHKSYLESTAKEHAGTFVRAESLPENIEIMHHMRMVIRDVDAEVRSWLLPWFGVPGVARPDFVHDLRSNFDRRVEREILLPLNQRFDDSLARALDELADNALSENELAFFISSLVERINLLAAYSDGVRGDDLFDYPGPFDNSAKYFPQPVDPLTVERLNDLYKQRLLWSSNPERAREELSLRRQQLVQLLEATGDRMTWLIPWANERVAGSGFTLNDFWNGSGRVDPDIRIQPAYTVAGREAIQDFLEQLWWSGVDEQRFQQLDAAFQEHYRERYLAAWEAFALNFGDGINGLRGRDEWLAAVNSLATPRNPHFLLLATLYEQIAHFDEAQLPEWALMVRYYDQMRSFAPDDGQDHAARNRVFQKMAMRILKKTGPVGKSLAKAGKQGMKTQKQLDKASARSGVTPDERELLLEEAGERLGEYRAALSNIAFDSDIRSASHAGAAGLFSNPDNPGKGEGPEAQAHEIIRRLTNRLGVVTQYNRAFWDVFSGPLHVVEGYFLQESACHLQDLWESEFLVTLEGVPRHRLPNLMFGESGELWQFIDQDLGPFVTRRFNAGYVPVLARGKRLPLREEFLEFATRGREGMQSRRDNYAVRIEALPTGTNDGAAHRPSRTALQLRCDNGDQDLVHHNFPVEGSFNWNGHCGDTVLAIDIGRYTLEKVYSGPHGFPEFLQDFRMGGKRLRPEHFPRHESILENYGVESIDVEFAFRGHEPVIASLTSVPLDPPRLITRCWE